MRRDTRQARLDTWEAGLSEARDRVERGEPLAILVVERRMVEQGGKLGRTIGQHDAPLWAFNGRWFVVQWNTAGGLVAFNRRSGRFPVEEWSKRRKPYVWVLSASSLKLAREIVSRAA